MKILDSFIAYLEEQVANHSIYVWGAQGQKGQQITETWIRGRETSDTNAARAIAFWKKQVAAGYGDVLRAFDCSGLGMYWLQNVTGLWGSDRNANGMKGTCTIISKSECRRGDWVFHLDGTGKATHIGYIVDAALNVIECQGRDAGVVKRPFSKGKWVAFGRPKVFEAEIVAENEPDKPEATQPEAAGGVMIRVKTTRTDGEVHAIPLEEYLRGVVPSEMYASWGAEALKAQAIAARTYAARKIRTRTSKEFDVDDTTSYQAYNEKKIDDRTDAAVAATAGVILTYEGEIAEAVYTASNGGRTASAEECWGNAVPYLIAQDDSFDTHKKSGHGVGLSQYGAQGRAKAGHDYEAIIAFYYPNTNYALAEEMLDGVQTQPKDGGWIVSRLLKRTEKPFMEGDDVRRMQEELIKAGFDCGSCGADGVFGWDTETAVFEFQRARSLQVDGKAGKQTITALGGTYKG